jgi:hypothetical protein
MYYYIILPDFQLYFIVNFDELRERIYITHQNPLHHYFTLGKDISETTYPLHPFALLGDICIWQYNECRTLS